MSKLDLASVLKVMMECERGVSDLNFTVGQPPQVESDGKLVSAVPPGKSILTAERTQAVADAILGDNPALRQTLEQTGSCDCSYVLPDGTRFRVNIFRAQGSLSIVLRALPKSVPSLDDLKLPSILTQIPQLHNGMVLVTGATGSGKSTTLAAVIDAINSTRAVHILTLEDPIEFRHPHKAGTVNQRQKGLDFASFADGLRAALRQAPKVVLVGEMRDRETVEIALKAAETGHLVVSTLHTVDAGQTVNRIAGMFQLEEQRLVRSRLAQVLRFVVAQRLLPKATAGRVAALEIMGSNLRVKELIESGETENKTFYQVIADSRPFGWQTFDQHIADLYAEGVIAKEVAQAYSSDRSVMRREIDRVNAKRGEDVCELGVLEMDVPVRPSSEKGAERRQTG